jgi:hypothetical protein
MVGFAVMKHTVQRLECIWASAASTTSAWCATSLAVVSGHLVKGCLIPLLWRWPKVLFPIFQWPTTIGINVVHKLVVTALNVIIVRRPWGFILLWNFSLLLKIAEMLDLRLAEFCKLFIQLWHYFWLLSN